MPSATSSTCWAKRRASVASDSGPPVPAFGDEGRRAGWGGLEKEEDEEEVEEGEGSREG